MTEAFLIVVRILLLCLLGYWGFRLWGGTRSWTSRAVSGLCIVVLVWQVVGGRF
jgi:hypothetical protein